MTSSNGSAELLYDADCGVCKFVLARLLDLDRQGRLRPVALQDPRAADALRDMTPEQRMASFHIVDPDGTVHSAGEGLAELLPYLPAGAPVGQLARRLPAVTDGFYRLVAGNRSRLGRLIPQSAKRQAERRIAAHSA